MLTVFKSKSSTKLPSPSTLLPSLYCGAYPLPTSFKQTYSGGNPLLKNYGWHDFLGEGGFGFVLSCNRLSDNTRVAVKFILKSRKESLVCGKTNKLPMEVFALTKLKHPNIIQLLDWYETQDAWMLVLEHFGYSWGGGKACDLFECIENHVLSVEAKQKIFRQLVKTVKFLHDVGLVHCDVKDENVLVDENYRIKLIDFGSVSFLKHYEKSRLRTGVFDRFRGTLDFAAPECFSCEYSAVEAEIWALGCLLYALVFGVNPFKGKEDIAGGRLYIPPYEREEQGGVELLKGMLERNPRRRVGMEQILRHSWLQ